mmetsp:Transcript_82449/g.148792  ORF Transcript_82449/g.148792 Transcript_82449/m.148792 type:complete len:265 (+) Transcript_82449:2802-3596(+)
MGRSTVGPSLSLSGPASAAPAITPPVAPASDCMVVDKAHIGGANVKLLPLVAFNFSSRFGTLKSGGVTSPTYESMTRTSLASSFGSKRMLISGRSSTALKITECFALPTPDRLPGPPPAGADGAPPPPLAPAPVLPRRRASWLGASLIGRSIVQVLGLRSLLLSLRSESACLLDSTGGLASLVPDWLTGRLPGPPGEVPERPGPEGVSCLAKELMLTTLRSALGCAVLEKDCVALFGIKCIDLVLGLATCCSAPGGKQPRASSP